MERRLGAGGFGVVWLAWDEKLEREVARQGDPARAAATGERVEREARAAARLNHPGIVAIYELASDDHDVYLVSELVRGRTLAELTKAGAISDRDVARIGIALCDALEHAHARGVIHRDVKPQNVMVRRRAGRRRGLRQARRLRRRARGQRRTRSRAPATSSGTLAYMAPEQAEGARVTPAVRRLLARADAVRGVDGHEPGARRGPRGDRAAARPAAALARAHAPRPAAASSATRSTTRSSPTRRCSPHPAKLRAELTAAERELTDEGGLVEPETLRRVGLATTERRGFSGGHG